MSDSIYANEASKPSGNRKAAEAFCLEFIKEVTGNDRQNVDHYKNVVLPSLSDTEFDALMHEFSSGVKSLAVVTQHGKDCLETERSVAVCRKHGYEPFQQLWMPGEGDDPAYLTVPEYPVFDVTIRRAAQRVESKMSVAKNSKSMDQHTGQYVNQSKGASMSYPQVAALRGSGAKDLIIENMTYRGGDRKGNAAFTNMLLATGEAQMSQLANYRSGVESKNYYRAILIAMHLNPVI